MLDHVQLACPAGSEDLSRGFYGDFLGMAELDKPPILAARGGCWFRGLGVEIHLGVEDDFRPARKAHPAVLINDLDQLGDKFRAAGIEITIEDQEIPGRRRFYAHDPHGNRLEFISDQEAPVDLVPGFQLRRAHSGDLPAMVRLLSDDQLGQHRESEDLFPYQQAFAEIDADPRQFQAVIVRTVDQQVIGMCQLTRTPGLSRGGTTRLTIEGVRVAAPLRNTGLGSAMINWAIAFARAHQIGLIQLTSDLTRTASITWYEKLGFQHSHAGLKLTLA